MAAQKVRFHEAMEVGSVSFFQSAKVPPSLLPEDGGIGVIYHKILALGLLTFSQPKLLPLGGLLQRHFESILLELKQLLVGCGVLGRALQRWC